MGLTPPLSAYRGSVLKILSKYQTLHVKIRTPHVSCVYRVESVSAFSITSIG